MDKIESILNSNSIRIITDKNFLTIPCEPVSSIEEGERIAMRLFRVLTERGDGVGLSANQIGIQKRVAVINVKTPIYLINPILKDFEGELIYFERCLSFPDMQIRTKRHSTIFVTCDNIPGGVYCDVSDMPKIKENHDLSKKLVNERDLDILECVAVQHEIGHLNGKTMFDFEYKQDPYTSNKILYDRNDKIEIFNPNTDITKTIKYKDFYKFQKDGYHIVDENMFDDLKDSPVFKPLFPENT